MNYSADGRRLLANYQGDQIYLFDAAAAGDNAGGGVRHAVASFGGHYNSETFLKQANFLGGGRYVVAGDDLGRALVWDAASGQVVSALKADTHVCNGVVAHPSLPVLASYGIDSNAKVWAPDWAPRAATPYRGYPRRNFGWRTFGSTLWEGWEGEAGVWAMNSGGWMDFEASSEAEDSDDDTNDSGDDSVIRFPVTVTPRGPLVTPGWSSDSSGRYAA
uniref:Peroxin-7 n=1 Tax=Phaeomonas parva TaxID=124430 RepID=A0A7S1XQP8_9STRA